MSKKKPKNNMQKRVVPKSLLMLRDFAEQRAQSLAALAWSGYLNEGRGFILITTELDGELSATYMGEKNEMYPKLITLIETLDPEVKRYTPEREYVVVYYAESLMRIDTIDSFPPPIAYKLMQTGLI